MQPLDRANKYATEQSSLRRRGPNDPIQGCECRHCGDPTGDGAAPPLQAITPAPTAQNITTVIQLYLRSKRAHRWIVGHQSCHSEKTLQKRLSGKIRRICQA